MSNVINYFLGNTIYILTLTRSGDPDQHPALLEEVSLIMQWVFNDSDEAIKAAEGIFQNLDKRLREAGNPELNPPINLTDVAAKSPDIMLALQLNDSEDDELYRIYISGFQKNGREWK